jgi:Doubled CXXCH motif (Paired_CXXCH_1)
MMPKPMIQRPKRFLLALCAITLLNVSILGCAQRSFAQKKNMQTENVQTEIVQTEIVQKGNAQSEGCRFCHAPNGAARAKDFSSIYAHPKAHHPVGVNYPLAAQADSNFKLPNGQSADIAFFDRNGNGQPDSDEIQLFGANGAVTVECASCHKEHGSSPVSGNAPADLYLRVANVGSALCITCHRQ